MAIIYSYPIATPQGTDLLIISRTPEDPDEISNYSVSMSSVADYVIDRFIDPDATDFQIPVFNQNGTRITGSIMSQDSSPSNGVTGTKLTIAGDLTLERDQSDTTLTLISDGSNTTPGGEQHNPSIKFIQDGGSQNAAVGFNIIDDTGGGTLPGTGNRFWIVNAIDDLTGEGGITFGTAQVDGWENAIGRFIIRGDGKGLFGHPDSLYSKTLGSQFEIYDNRDENTTTDPSFSVYSVVDYAAPSGNEGAGGIKQILDVYDNGVFQQQEAMMLIPGTNSSDVAASTPLAFYTNSNMDTAGPSGFAGIIFDSGNWLLDGSGTFTTTDPGYQLKVAGTGLFTSSLLVGVNNTAPGSYSMASGQDNNVLGNEAVALGFNNTVEGNRCGALGANNIVTGGQVWATGDGNDVGIEKLNVGGNIVTSGFNNTVKSGNSCAIGSGNILTNTLEEQSVNTNFALGSSNTLNDVTNVLSLGFNNTINNDKSYTLGKNNITSANDTYAIGSNNTLSSEDDYAFGLNNTLSGSANIAMALGHNNILSGSQSYAFGRNLIDGGQNDTTIIGRYNTTPTATGRIVFGTGFSNTGRKNAIEIQAGNAAQSGLLFPALRLSNSYNNDAEAEAAGVERGELYRSNNSVRINIDQNAQDARNNEGLAFLTPRVKTLTQGEIFDYLPNYNIVKIEFSGSGSSAEVRLPLASSVTNRVFRIVTGSSLIGKQINITVQGGGTINGVPNQILFNQYAGTAIWSDGVEYQFVP